MKDETDKTSAVETLRAAMTTRDMSEIIPDVHDIVAAYLTEHGYDGLCDGESGCACDMTCLMCCGEPWGDCTAGTKQSDGETVWMFPGHEACGGHEQVVGE